MPRDRTDLGDVVNAGRDLGLSIKREGWTKKKRRRIMQAMAEDEARCFCRQIFERPVHNHEEDPIIREFEYYGKYDFLKEGPKRRANMRKCRICGGEYSDALPMA